MTRKKRVHGRVLSWFRSGNRGNGAVDLEDRRIPRVYLQRLLARGELVKHGRGLYRLPDAELADHYSFAQASKRVPQGVVCLLSALSYHGLTTQTPSR